MDPTPNRIKGQALIESLVVGLLLSVLVLALFYTILTSTQVFIWHQKMNQVLLCSLDDSKIKVCTRDLSTRLGRREKFRLTLCKFNFLKDRQRPRLDIELEGFFNERYRLSKQISSSKWKL